MMNKTELAIQSYAAGQGYLELAKLKNAEQCWAMLSNAEQCWAMLSNAEQLFSILSRLETNIG